MTFTHELHIFTIRMMRHSLQVFIMLILTVTFGAYAASQLVGQAAAANLKNLAVIEGSVIRAGDVFEGLERNGERILGAAPQPGKDMVLNSRTLLRIAVALDIPWRPNGGEQIVIRRAATLIPADMMSNALHNAAANEGLDGRFELIPTAPLQGLVLPQQEAATLEVTSFRIDSARDVFTAEIVAPSLDNPLRRQSVSGKIRRLVSVPVLNTNLQNGMMISNTDIDWIDLPAERVQHDMALNAESLVGMTPRRILMSGKPVLMNDLIPPLLVKRGETVRITFTEGPITLTSEGKALQSGAKGDIIRVVSNASNRTIDAHVTSDRSVTVK